MSRDQTRDPLPLRCSPPRPPGRDDSHFRGMTPLVKPPVFCKRALRGSAHEESTRTVVSRKWAVTDSFHPEATPVDLHQLTDPGAGLLGDVKAVALGKAEEPHVSPRLRVFACL
jgi:hypothetical protein